MTDRHTAGFYPVHLAIGDPLMSSLFELTLTEAGYEAVMFQSARKLWENFAACRPRFVITEGRFNDGFEALNLCRLIRRDYPQPYVYLYIVSRRHEIEAIEDALDAGADDYSIKPVNSLQLRTRVLVGMRRLAQIDSPCAVAHLPPAA
ncbi:MAG TPA: response regulator [Verrucomicrobiae bacterium]|nr:response regulator [Verrucomicrobiae bacterium]